MIKKTQIFNNFQLKQNNTSEGSLEESEVKVD